jgi:hypothetical protein
MDTVAASSATRPSAMSSRFTIPGEPPQVRDSKCTKKAGMRPRVRDDLNRDVRAARHRNQVHELITHHHRPAYLAVDRALVDQRTHHGRRRIFTLKDRLPGQPPR